MGRTNTYVHELLYRYQSKLGNCNDHHEEGYRGNPDRKNDLFVGVLEIDYSVEKQIWEKEKTEYQTPESSFGVAMLEDKKLADQACKET